MNQLKNLDRNFFLILYLVIYLTISPHPSIRIQLKCRLVTQNYFLQFRSPMNWFLPKLIFGYLCRKDCCVSTWINCPRSSPKNWLWDKGETPNISVWQCNVFIMKECTTLFWRFKLPQSDMDFILQKGSQCTWTTNCSKLYWQDSHTTDLAGFRAHGHPARINAN